MKEILLQLAMAGIGTAGFALLFHVRLRNLPAALLGGIGAWAAYLLLEHFTKDPLVSNMGASFLVCVWAEIMARVMKAPVNVFMITGLIPLVPGAGLYYTMLALVNQNTAELTARGSATGIAMLGIAVGIVAESVLFLYIMDLGNALRKRKKKDKNQ